MNVKDSRVAIGKIWQTVSWCKQADYQGKRENVMKTLKEIAVGQDSHSKEIAW